MATEKQIQAYLDTLPDKVVRHTKVVKSSDNPYQIDYMLHVSTAPKLKTFIPRIGTRQMREEDRTTPRICVAPHLLGCVLGYVSWMADFNKLSDGSEEQGGWVGGWTVYAFDYDFCLRPNNQMVPDARISDEHWLVTHSPDTVEYKPRVAAKMFIQSVTMTSRSEDYPAEEFVLLIEVQEPDGILFSTDIRLPQGYHRIKGPNIWMIRDYKAVSAYEITPLQKETFMQFKHHSAALLGYQEPAEFLKW